MKSSLNRVAWVVILPAFLSAVPDAMAGRVTSSRPSVSRYSAPVRSTGPSPGRGIYSAPSRPSGGSPAFSQFTPTIRQGSTRRQSVLPGSASGPGPSPRLQSVIREKERSGPGWVGTAMLVWLLSQNDMSSSDRQWVEKRLAETKEKDPEVAPSPPGQDVSDVAFSWSLPSSFIAGQPVDITVTARRGQAHPVPDCELNGIHSSTVGESAVLTWITDDVQTAVISCKAGGVIDQRLLTVTPAPLTHG